MNKIYETLDECKEVIEVFKDADYTLSVDCINRVMRVLAILGSIILPFLVISSLYGMNVFLPGGQYEGTLLSFVLLLVSMLVIAGTMLYFFYRKRWI